MTVAAQSGSILTAVAVVLIAGAAAAVRLVDFANPTRAGVSSAPAATLTTDAGGPLFSIPAAAPGHPVRQCVRVTYSGRADEPVRLSATGAVPGDLASLIDIVVEVGTGGGYGDCAAFSGQLLFTGTLAELQANHPDHANGLTAFVGSQGVPSRTFRFTVQARDDNAAQGRTAGVTFAWTVVNTAPTATPPADSTPPAETPPTWSPGSAQPPSDTPATPPTGTEPAPSHEPSTSSPNGRQTAPPTAAPAQTTTSSGSRSVVGTEAAATASPARSRHSTTTSHRQAGSHRPAPTATKPAGKTASPRQPHRTLLDRLVSAVEHAAGAVGRRGAFPVVLVTVMVLFLLLQDRIDRRDPKLALAPLRSDDRSFTDGPRDGEHGL